MVIVHRKTMRVMPHKSTTTQVMKINQESRAYAQRYFYDIKLDVWTLAVDYDYATELHKYESTQDGRKQREALSPNDAADEAMFTADFWLYHLRYKLHHSLVEKLEIRAKDMEGRTDTKRKGAIYLSSKHDRFALTKKSFAGRGPWGHWLVDMCERAFLRDHIGVSMNQALATRNRLNPHWPYPYIGSGDMGSEFLARHMSGRLLPSVLKKIRQVVYLREYGTELHDCGTDYMSTQDWKVGTCFKGAETFYTAKMITIPSTAELQPQHLFEWKKSDKVSSFRCSLLPVPMFIPRHTNVL